MSTKSTIKSAISKHVSTNSVWFIDYTNWYVGITSDPKTRRSSHGRPNKWKHWRTDHHTHARDIEAHFLDEGMKGDTGGGTYPRYVYVYKHSGPGS